MKSINKLIINAGEVFLLIMVTLTFSCDLLTNVSEKNGSTTVSVTGVTLTPATTSLKTGDTVQLTSGIVPSDASNSTLSWSSSHSAVASVNENGLVTAISEGSTVITVTTNDGGFTAHSSIDVTAQDVIVNGITLSPQTQNIVSGTSVQLTAVITPSDASNTTVFWSSSNSSVAAVNSDGLVTGLSAGISTITVTAEDGGLKATSSITVTAATVNVAGISLSSNSETLRVGETIQLGTTIIPSDATDCSVSWSSSNVAVATVNNGLVTAVNIGTATVTVTTNDGDYSDTALINVEKTPVTSVNLNTSSETLHVNDTVQLTATVIPSDATDASVSWSSDNTSAATVNSNGFVTAKGIGSATITVTTNDQNKKASIIITVEAIPVTGISLSHDNATLEVDKTLKLTATVLPSDATDQSVTWSTSNSSVASVTDNGLVTANAAGSAIITAKADGGNYSASATITIPSEPVLTTKDIRLSFGFDETNATSFNNIYVIWLEGSNGHIQHVYVCDRLLHYFIKNGNVTYITDYESALPFWHVNYYDKYCDASNTASYDPGILADVDAVTGATNANEDFTVTTTIDDSLGDHFTIYFELDESFEFNNAFPGKPYNMHDQPAVLFKKEIDLNNIDPNGYTLDPVGFTPMYDSYPDFIPVTDDAAAYNSSTESFFQTGTLIEKLSYITRSQIEDESGDTIFGTVDLTNSALRAVDHEYDAVNDIVEFTGITATITDTP